MQENFKELSIELIHPSPTNPRKRFNQQALNDMAETIKVHGVMQPILVREIEGLFTSYEIIAGERRWRASKIAEKTTIPVLVQTLTNAELLEFQFIENAQREDLHPLEEADALRQMLSLEDEAGKKVWSADQLGKQIGKSRSYVYESLKLCDLSNYAKDKFYDGQFKRETALLIARIPGEKLQERLVKTIIDSELSVRAARDYIHRDFTFDLKNAPWDKFDETVLADAPSCAKCPQRSGNYPELCSDIESPDVCTDPTCYNKKKTAYADRVIKIMPRVIHGEQADQVMPYGHEYYATNGYVKDISTVAVDGFTAAELLGDDAPEPFTLVDKFKNVGQVYSREEVETALKAKIQEKIDSGELQPSDEMTSKEKQNALTQQKRDYAETINPILTGYFRERLQQLNELFTAGDFDTTTALYNYFYENLFQSDDVRDFLYNTFGHGHIEEFSVYELLLCLMLGNKAHFFAVGHRQISNDFTLESHCLVHQYAKTLKNLTGVALPPLPAAQAQDITPTGQAEPGEPATAPDVATAETPVNEDIAQSALPIIEPAEAAGDLLPASQEAISLAIEAPLSGFEKAKRKGEAAAARRKAIKAKKESGQPDTDKGADQSASANHTH